MWRNTIKEMWRTHKSYKGSWGEKDSIAQSLTATAASTYVQKETNVHPDMFSMNRPQYLQYLIMIRFRKNRPQYAMSPRPV